MLDLDIRGWQLVKICGHIAKVFSWQMRPNRLWYLNLEPELVFLWRYVTRTAGRAVSQVLRSTRQGYFAGFCSQGRGLSWDRRSRYGKK